MKNVIDTIIFDLGGVLIDWNPKYVYREVFNGDEKKVDWFLNNICTPEWNVEQDAGRTLQQGTDALIDQFPEYEDWIRVFYDRWEDMLGNAIHDTVGLLKSLNRLNTLNLYALTNWSAETFHVALHRFQFLNYFKAILVSGQEKTRKPFPKIYEIMIERYELNPNKCLFIDDNFENVEAAKKFGMLCVHFKNAEQLRSELAILGIEC
jgi:2-haloacid dehalogenase